MRGNFGLKLQNSPKCLTNMLDYIVMQMKIRLFTASLFSARKRKCESSERKARRGGGGGSGVCEWKEQEQILIPNPLLSQSSFCAGVHFSHDPIQSKWKWEMKTVKRAIPRTSPFKALDNPLKLIKKQNEMSTFS